MKELLFIEILARLVATGGRYTAEELVDRAYEIATLGAKKMGLGTDPADVLSST